MHERGARYVFSSVAAFLANFQAKQSMIVVRKEYRVSRRNGTCILYIDVQTRTILNIIGTSV